MDSTDDLAAEYWKRAEQAHAAARAADLENVRLKHLHAAKYWEALAAQRVGMLERKAHNPARSKSKFPDKR